MMGWLRTRPTAGRDVDGPAEDRRALVVGAYPNDLGPKNALLAMSMPHRLDVERPAANEPRSAAACVAIRSMSGNHFVIDTPFSASFQWRRSNGEWDLDIAGVDVAPSIVTLLATPVPPQDWRDPERPILQIATAYNFVTDEPCWITLTPPFLHPGSFKTMGTVLSGRWDLYAWPRPVSFAFEWSDWTEPLVLRRGEPLLYARFDGADQSRSIALVEAELTDWLTHFNAQYTALASSFGNARAQMHEARQLRDRGLGPDRWLNPVRGGRATQ